MLIHTPLSRWLEAGWAQPAETHGVAVQGARVNYRGWGLADTGKPGLIFVHGFFAHARWWDHIAPWFVDRFRVAALDLTGMGDSDHRPAYSRKQYSDEIIGVAVDAALRRVTLVAHSFGSVSALYAAHLRPDLIERVIVIDANVFRREDEQVRAVPGQKFYESREAALLRYRLTPPGLWPEPAITAYLAEHSIIETPQGWRWKFDPETVRNAHREEIRSEVHGLSLAVDYIHGDQSEIAGPGTIASFLAAMPNCGTPVAIPMSHHHIMIEQPIALVTALRGLLANNRTGIARNTG